MNMEIAKSLVRDYLTSVTSYAGDIGGAPEDVTEYHESVLDMKLAAEERGDLKYLQLAIDRLLVDPSENAPSYARIHYHYSPEEMKELLGYIRSVVWPDLPPPKSEDVKRIHFVEMSAEEWRAGRENIR
jgi:hypothetical protein